MKKIILTFFIYLLFQSFAFSKMVNEIYSGISNEQLIFYSYCSNKWYYNVPKQNKKCILPVKRKVLKSNDGIEYSSYMKNEEMIFTPSGATYEFIYNGKLITFNEHDIKFFEIVYNKRNKNFAEVPISEKLIKKITGNPELIYISDFDKNNKIIKRKFPLKKEYYLLINDTDRFFYGYELDTSNKDRIINKLFFAKKSQRINFTHYFTDKAEYPKYEIIIKNCFSLKNNSK